MPKPLPAEGSDRQGKLVERDRQAPSHRLLDRELVVASSKVLDERMAGGEDASRAESLEAAHRPKSGFESAMVGPNGIVRILLGCMER